ncbi:Phox homologous domain-containing protein [Parachaetomium inaequale]|uniref:Endosomal/vacuolar adapter protein YPT35 n=1 Tax=Parachaetomium inaequale TaxID=2588326 RepID=A0AAN6STH2_9PEZI|nr:Phox homologous domain-containing protein [Parachaetomium inaequale]
MASDNEHEQHPQPPAQQEQPPEIPHNDDGSAAGKDAEDPTRQEPVNGTAQSTSPSLEPESQRAALFSEDEGDNDNASTASIPSDAASEQVTSPSSSIPPYWSSSRAEEQQLQQQNQLRPHPSGHTRVVSSASAESVLPPGAITLQDNEREDDDDTNNNGTEPTGRRSNSSELYGRDRNRACWARSVQVTDYVLVNGSTTNIGAFVVWHIRVETLNGSRMNIRKRYSEFDDLRKRLVQTFPGFEAAVPALPPKSLLKRFHPRFLEKRRAGLQYFLNCILLNPEFSGSPVLKEFLFS